MYQRVSACLIVNKGKASTISHYTEHAAFDAFEHVRMRRVLPKSALRAILPVASNEYLKRSLSSQSLVNQKQHLDSSEMCTYVDNPYSYSECTQNHTFPGRSYDYCPNGSAATGPCNNLTQAKGANGQAITFGSSKKRGKCPLCA